jgi:hypothetical protein
MKLGDRKLVVRPAISARTLPGPLGSKCVTSEVRDPDSKHPDARDPDRVRTNDVALRHSIQVHYGFDHLPEPNEVAALACRLEPIRKSGFQPAVG